MGFFCDLEMLNSYNILLFWHKNITFQKKASVFHTTTAAWSSASMRSSCYKSALFKSVATECNFGSAFSLSRSSVETAMTASTIYVLFHCSRSFLYFSVMGGLNFILLLVDCCCLNHRLVLRLCLATTHSVAKLQKSLATSELPRLVTMCTFILL